MTVITASAARVGHFARKCVVPLLVLETIGLLGLLTSWRVAAIAAVGVVLVIGAVSALRRASHQVDRILREELAARSSSDGESKR